MRERFERTETLAEDGLYGLMGELVGLHDVGRSGWEGWREEGRELERTGRAEGKRREPVARDGWSGVE